MSFPLSRRTFIGGTAATVGAAALWTPGMARAAGTYTRVSMTSPEGLKMLESYKVAIKAMLALPPTDPRNWYRLTLTHTLDCPHGNWWFVVWHRGYIGWFEEICRDLSGNPDFALPYWDWTESPFVPDSFFGNVLDPTSSAYIQSFSDFKAAFAKPMEDYYATLDSDQLAQLALRDPSGTGAVTTAAALFTAIEQGGMFFDIGQARGLTKAEPNFDTYTADAVALDTVEAALMPDDFVEFGSGIVPQHSSSTDQGELESQPHNQVHNNTGGFMGNFMSPTDPLFYMHHSNIDRLWNTWTRKQQQNGDATLPTGADLAKWRAEPFLFFHGPDGKPTSQKTAQAYETIGSFDYDYTPGSGDGVLKTSDTQLLADVSLSSRRTSPSFGTNSVGTARFKRSPAAVMATVAGPVGAGLVAHIRIKPPMHVSGVHFAVFLNVSPKEALTLGPDSPHYAGGFQFFGPHAHGAGAGDIGFNVDLSRALKALRSTRSLKSRKGLRVQVVMVDKTGSSRSLSTELVSIDLRSR